MNPSKLSFKVSNGLPSSKFSIARDLESYLAQYLPELFTKLKFSPKSSIKITLNFKEKLFLFLIPKTILNISLHPSLFAKCLYVLIDDLKLSIS